MIRCLILSLLMYPLLMLLYTFHFALLSMLKVLSLSLKVDIALRKSIEKIRTNLILRWARVTGSEAIVVALFKGKTRKDKVKKAA